jgi:hypothetical protein
MAIHEEIIIDVTDNGMSEATKQANALAAATKKAGQESAKMGKEMDNSSQSVLDNGGAMGLLNDATGGFAMMVKDAVEASVLFTKSQRIAAIQQKVMTFAVGTSTGAMKAFRIALISTGIGAIVVAIGLLIANFDKVKKAVLNLVPGLAVIGDAIGMLVDVVTDFIGVTSDATRELDNMVAKSEESLKRNEHFLEANGDKFDQYTQRKIKANIEYNKKVKELNDDEELTTEEKLKRLQDFRAKADREIIKSDADRQAELQKARDAESEKAREQQEKITAANKKRLEDIRKAEEEAAIKKAEQDKRINEQLLANEKAQDDLEIQRELDKEALLKSIRTQSEEDKIAEEEAAAMRRLELADASQAEFLEISQYYFGKREDLRAQEDAQNEQLAQDQKVRDEAVAANRLAVAANTANLIAQLAGEGSAIAKGVAVAQATIDTYKGAVSAYSSLSGIPIVGPALGAVAAGVVVAAGIANVKKILATKPVEKGAPSGGASFAAPVAPSFNLVQGTGANQIATAVAGQNKPVQAFVVSSNVTTAQSMDRNIIENSKL